VAHEFNDEFTGSVLSNRWSTYPATYDDTIDMTSPVNSSNLHLKLHGSWLWLQGHSDVASSYIYQDISSHSADDPFTVVTRFCSFPGSGVTDEYVALTIRGENDNQYYSIRCGRYGSEGRVYGFYCNGGLQTVTEVIFQNGVSYLMLQYSPSAGEFHSWFSTDGCGWSFCEYSRVLGFPVFTQLRLELLCKYGVVGFDFVRWWDDDEVYLIGGTG